MAAESQLNIVVNAQDNASSALQSLGQKLGGILQTVGVAALAAGGAIAAFAEHSVHQFADMGDSIERMSIKTGMSTESVSALRVAAELGSGSLDQMGNAIKKMDVNLLKMEGSTKLAHKELGDLGLNIDKLKGMKPEDQFMALGNAIAKIQDPSLRAAKAVQIFGVAGLQLIPFFEKMGGNFDMLKQRATELGLVFDEKMAKNAEQMHTDFQLLGLVMESLAVKIGSALAPTLIKAFDQMYPYLIKFIDVAGQFIPKAVEFMLKAVQEAWGWFNILKDKAIELYAALNKSGVISFLTGLLKALWAMIQEQLVPAWDNLMEALRPHLPMLEKIAEVLGGVLVIAFTAAIGAVMAIVLTLTTLLEWVTKGIDAWDKYSKKVIDVWGGIKKVVQDTVTFIGGLVDNLLQKWNSMVDAITHPVASIKGAISNFASSVGVNLGISARASGGPVSSGSPYMVGERGPELFVPSGNGAIVPTNALSFGGGVNVVMNIASVSNSLDVKRMAQMVGEEILKKLKANVQV